MKRVLGIGLALVVVMVAAVALAFQLSPWPKVLLIRMAFDKGANAAAAALEKHLPAGVETIEGQPYDAAEPSLLLDVFLPPDAKQQPDPFPVIVWVHGGAYVYGRRDNVANYGKILASRGYAVVTLDYSKAPGTTYPAPLRQLNTAIGYLQVNAARLHIDKDRMFLAGDSAGAQIVGQMSNLIAVPDYASDVGIEPSIGKAQLRGVILHCGPYGTDGIDFDGPFGGFLSTVLWSYFGTRDFRTDPRLKEFSVVEHMTGDFPAAFISVGNADPLAPLSYQLKQRADELGVPMDALFFAKDYQPPLGHEYQFDLDSEAGRTALDRTVSFLEAHR